MRISKRLQNLVIPNGNTTSNELDSSNDDYRFARGFVLSGDSTYDGTITVEISLDDGATFQTLQSNGSDVNVVAGKALVITQAGWSKMRLVSSTAETADRTTLITAMEDT